MPKGKKRVLSVKSQAGGDAWQAVRVNQLVQAQIPERHPVSCGDCQWAGDVVLVPDPDNSTHGSWICPKCGVRHVVKVASQLSM